MPILLLIQGLPGAGKTTLAQEVYVPQGYAHFEDDQFFYRNGKYVHEPKRIEEARKWCRDRAYEALSANRNVVVSNIFGSKWTVEPYRALAKALKADLQIVTLTTQFESIHIQNKARLEDIRSRWKMQT
jgi:predicted kinase